MSCPICQKAADPAYRPFCSKRCADVDLAHWLRGTYAVPGRPVSSPEEDDADRGADREKPH